jgi:hypothetical protein
MTEITDDGQFLSISIQKPYGEHAEDVLNICLPYESEDDRAELKQNLLNLKHAAEFECDLDQFEEGLSKMMENMEIGDRKTVSIDDILDLLLKCKI